MEELIKWHFPVKAVEQAQEASLDYEEKNALRYTVRALTKVLQRSAHPLKEELRLCLTELTEDETRDGVDESEEWTRSIDRGGLKHVNDTTYMFFATMELVLQAVPQQQKSK